jgi:hypothetical protein
MEDEVRSMEDGAIPQPQIAIRRWGDACFHLVDEEVEEGYILGGHLIAREDVLEVRTVAAGEACPRRPVAQLRIPAPPRPDR